MISYRISPYVSFIENRLIPGVIQHGVSHRLTGEVLEPGERVRSLLLAIQSGSLISLSAENLNSLGDDGRQLQQLIEKEFLIPDGHDPLTRFVNHYVVRPIQNPALVYRSEDGVVWLVRTSMTHQVFSRRAGELPEVIEEAISQLAAAIFKSADGTKTLLEIFAALGRNKDKRMLDDAEFREVLDFLTSQERQLIKFTSQREDLAHPYMPVNIVPRDLYHSSKWNAPPLNGSSESIIDFHKSGIENAEWEFEQIEPTVNHSFRFPNEALGGFDYGSRFAIATLRPEVVPLVSSDRLEVLEVGGGTGTFARSFLEQSQSMIKGVDHGIDLNYHILDLSAALMESQRKLLSQRFPESRYFHQDATKFSIPSHRFDLIIANEVIADFPMAIVRRGFSDGPDSERKEALTNDPPAWDGPGAHYLEKYGLSTDNAPDDFLVSAGAFDFIERCFEHLSPGGALLVSEYGSAHQYPVQAYQLNHEEFSVHFGYLAACAARVGFHCRLLTLKEFLSLDDSVPVLAGRQDHFMILNHVLKKHGMSLPYVYAITSKGVNEADLEKAIYEELGKSKKMA